MDENRSPKEKTVLPLYVITGGVGTSGEQLSRTVLAQFPDAGVSIQVRPKVFTQKHVTQILDEAKKAGGIVAHTFVDPKLRQVVIDYAQESNLISIDLVGPLMEKLVEKLGQEPLGKPGLYRQLYRSYFDRIQAMDYVLDHDDGQRPAGWKDAEIVLLGASRVGKTPISLYLSVLGWKVANIPLVAGIKPNEALSQLDRRRLVGLTIAPSELLEHRKHRQSTLGVSGKGSAYIDPVKIYHELEATEAFLRRKKIAIIDVTGKPIETSADEVLSLVRRRLDQDDQRKNTEKGII